MISAAPETYEVCSAWLSWPGPQMIHSVRMITIWVTLIDVERRAGREDLLGRASSDV